MHLRPADKSDIHAIASLHAANWRRAYRGTLSEEYLVDHVITDRLATWERRLSSPVAGQFITVAEESGQLIGFACGFAGSDPVWGTLLDNIHVALPNQRQGVGSELLRQIARWCMTEAPDQGLYLWVNQSNITAQHFYAFLGAKNVGSDVWNSPDGGIVPTFRYAWRHVRDLLPRG